MQNEKQPLASEMIQESREHIKSIWNIVVFQWVLIVALICALIGTNVYHIYQWSQFDTVVVDGEENANYVQGDNAGGIFNGADSGQTQEERQEQGYQN